VKSKVNFLIETICKNKISKATTTTTTTTTKPEDSNRQWRNKVSFQLLLILAKG